MSFALPSPAHAIELIRSRQKGLTRALGALAVAWAVGWLAVPPIVKSQLAQHATAALGRQVSVDAVSFKPWTLELEVRGLRMATADGQDTQFSVDRLYADAELASLFRLAPVVDAVQIDHPVLHLRHLGQGKHDLQDVLDKLAPPDQQPEPDTGPARLAIYNIQLRDGQVDLHDAPEDNHHSLTDITLAIPFVSTLGVAKEVRVSPKLAFKLNGSPFETEATAQPFNESLSTEATLKISGFNLTPYLDYLPKNLPVRPAQATLGADLNVAFAQSPQASVRITGHMSADDVALTDARQQPLLKLARARVELADVRPLERVVLLGQVELTEPQAHLGRDAQGLLNTATRTPNSEANKSINTSEKAQKSLKNMPTDTPDTGGWVLGVSTFKLTDGSVAWADALTPDAQQQPARLALTQLQANASQLHWPLPTDATQAVAFDATAQLAGGSPGAATTATAAATDTVTTVTGKTTAPSKTKANGKPSTPAIKAKPEPKSVRTAAAPPPARAPMPASLNLKGTVLANQADTTVAVNDLALPLLAPYLRAHLTPTVQGLLTFNAQATWKPAQPAGTATPATADDLTLTLGQLNLSQFKLIEASGTEAASLQTLDVRDAQLRPLARTANLGKVSVTRPVLPVRQDPQGQLMFAQWLTAAPGASAGSPQTGVTPTPGAPAATAAQATHPPAAVNAQQAPSAQADTAWTWQLPELTVTDGQFGWQDTTTTPAVALQTSAFKLQVQRLVSRGGPPAEVSASMRVGAGQAEPGTLSWRGTLALGDDGQTPQVKGKLDALRLPAHALAPYAAAQLNLTLLRADASFLGSLAYGGSPNGPAAQLAGDATLENFRADTVASGQVGAEEWLRWKTLNLKGLDVKLAPATATQVSVERGALSDFFARIVIQENGRINLQDISKQAAADAATAATTAPANGTGNGAATTAATAPAQTPTSAPATPQASSPPADPLATRISIGPFSLVNGAVDFSDKFIRPNYQANLSDLTGRLGGFSSDGATAQVDGQTAPQMAELELRGKAEGTASLEIIGKLNPLAKPLALDIEGRVRDLELPPLSPYTVKYTGHGIERGKLSLDVNYTVLPNGQLTARNQLVLNQLTFGEAVPGAPASLPVKLATALLSDRNGVIDLNLPISGSLNDPEFSLVPIIFKIIGNIIVKAITAPFSLLAGALGGSDAELATVAFVPGTAQLLPAAQDKLARVAKALTDRPSLTLTVVGTASLDDERTAYQRERLQAQIRAERQRNMPDATAALPDMPPGSTEHTRWLTAVYKRADMPKPRNALGLTKDLPPADMEALLLTQIPVSDTTMKELAVQRGVAVRDQLAKLQVPTQRLFLGAPGSAPPHDAGATPQAVAHLTLAMR